LLKSKGGNNGKESEEKSREEKSREEIEEEIIRPLVVSERRPFSTKGLFFLPERAFISPVSS